jgi:hypothetical protein
VVSDGEIAVVLPYRCPVPTLRPGQHLMKPLDITDAFLDMSTDPLQLKVADLVQQRPPVEKRKGRDVHRHALLLDPEVAQVQRADPVDAVVSTRK